MPSRLVNVPAWTFKVLGEAFDWTGMATELKSEPEDTAQLGKAAPVPIVGVVASAGGLEAAKLLFAALPNECGMAFVFVPHLDPRYKSQMVALLSKICSLPVVEARQGMVVEVDHVYVIPSQNYLTIGGGALQLSQPPTSPGYETAIDFFLRSLAKDQGERSIGIVLSGTGSHGTLGIRDIKLAGGMAIAQEPTTAEFNTMPASIISEGLADYVLSPADMPATLMQYIRQPYINPPDQSVQSVETDDDYLNDILAQLRKHSGYDFGSYRRVMLMRRVQRRMGLHQLEQVEQYVQLITDEPKEAVALYRDLLISVTAFFRDPEAYQALADRLLPELRTCDATRFPFRVWIPGCATGEEAYSLAMLLDECIGKRPNVEGQPASSDKRIQIFASDVDDSAISIARAGIYPSSITSDVSQERLKKFFHSVDVSHYQVGKQLRDSIVFSRQNVICDAPFSKLDLISCRNLLIYLEPEMQQRVISLFHFALADHGLLVLGPSESIARSEELFEPISKKWRIFQKVASIRRSQLPVSLLTTQRLQRPLSRVAPAIAPRYGYRELVEKLLISHYAPASALINRRYEVLYMSGPLINYLHFPSGEPNQNILAMCRPGLRSALRIACRKSIAEQSDTQIEAKIKRGEESAECELHVRISKTRKDGELLLLISFADKAHVATDATQSIAMPTPDSKVPSDLEQLERELKLSGDELGSVIEELEDTNEDLKTSNEEIMSMNEELQSSNEDLETSKEELQSLNEELSTVNSELLEKVTELDIANNDILNLMSSTEIATLFLDSDLLIQRFTPPTVKLLSLRSTDLGRPLSDITTRFVDNSLLGDCRKVIQETQPMQSEVTGEDARLYLRRILPYRSHSDQVVGVVVTFVDLTDRLSLEKSLKESKEHLQSILDSAADAILTVDGKGLIASLNPATESLFGYQREEILGKSILSLLMSTDGDGNSIASPNHELLMSKCGVGNYQELMARRTDGSLFAVELAVNRIDHMALYIVVMRDVSQRKALQSQILSIASDEQRRIGQELHDGTQQELTGLSLIAGTIEDYMRQNTVTNEGGHQILTLDQPEKSPLMLSVTKLVRGLGDANKHVQALAHGIMPVQVDAEGLQSALAELADVTSAGGKTACHFSCTDFVEIESNIVATHLYRIAQEAVTNAQRHGKAKSIRISLSSDQHQIRLEIDDDGIGLTASTTDTSVKLNSGAGLDIMKYRSSVIGGSLSVLAGSNKGTLVRCTIPRQRKLG